MVTQAPTTQTVIEVVGDLVTLKKITTEMQGNLADILPHLVTRTPDAILNLPRNLRHYARTPDGSNTLMELVIENDPGMRRISFMEANIRTRGVPINNYLLNFPWTYFVFQCRTTDPTMQRDWAVQNWTVWFSRDRILDMRGRVLPAMLPNVYYENGNICFGNLGIEANGALGQYIDETVNTFWTSTFNTDLTIKWPANYQNFTDWQTAAALNQSNWLDWPQLTDARLLRNFRDVLTTASDRFAPVIIPNTIPNVPLPMTFDNINQWFRSMDDTGRERIRDHLSGAGQTTLLPPHLR